MKGQQNANGPKMGPVGWGGKTLPHQNDTWGKLLKELLIYTIYNGVYVGQKYVNQYMNIELTSYIDNKQNVWFKGKDFAKILGYSNTKRQY